MSDLAFEVVETTLWEKLTPPATAKKTDQYVAIVDALEAGHVVKLPTKDNTEMKGKRIVLGKRVRARGFSVEYRVEGSDLYVKKSDETSISSTPKTTRKKKDKVARP